MEKMLYENKIIDKLENEDDINEFLGIDNCIKINNMRNIIKNNKLKIDDKRLNVIDDFLEVVCDLVNNVNEELFSMNFSERRKLKNGYNELIKNK